jgi:hypothetical protein
MVLLELTGCVVTISLAPGSLLRGAGLAASMGGCSLGSLAVAGIVTDFFPSEGQKDLRRWNLSIVS